jgi:hypothetical protein
VISDQEGQMVCTSFPINVFFVCCLFHFLLTLDLPYLSRLSCFYVNLAHGFRGFIDVYLMFNFLMSEDIKHDNCEV